MSGEWPAFVEEHVWTDGFKWWFGLSEYRRRGQAEKAAFKYWKRLNK